MKALIAAVALVAVAAPSIAKDDGRVQIKSGANGSTYCTPMDDPRCKSHFAMEAQRLNERRELDRRYEDMDRRDRERQREFEYRLERDRYRDEYRR